MSLMTWLGVPGLADKWEACGFRVESEQFLLGGVWFEVNREPAWGFSWLGEGAEGFGVPTDVKPIAQNRDFVHPNGVHGIDHIVYAVPDLDAAVQTFADALQLTPRRRFYPRGPDGPEMVFFKAGATVIEVVAGPREPGLWGIAFLCPDLDATVAAIRAAGGPIGDPKTAVQGGRIASVWKGHVGWGVAIMEPPVRT